MKTSISAVVILLSITFLLTGCVTYEKDRKIQEPEKISSSVFAQEEEFGTRLLDSIRTGDYKKFVRLMGDSPSGKMSEEEFKSTRKNLERQFGSMTDVQFLTNLKTPVVQNLVWKVTFVRKNDKGKKIEQELMFRLVVGVSDGKLHVIGMGFL